ncbi:hypothetical protein ACL02S_16680 [Nocardia sp. 004]|uniref:hypothetical protein n=1 Tax=Nocardia sp. 004 TaxID=3385978 RepID=UPI0039A3EAE4
MGRETATEGVGIVARLAASPGTVDALAANFVLDRLSRNPAGQWIVRAMVSLLTLPGAGEGEERATLQNFVLLFLFGDRTVID